MSKNYFMLVAVLLSFYGAVAQVSFDFERYEDKPNVHLVSISKYMLKMMGKVHLKTVQGLSPIQQNRVKDLYANRLKAVNVLVYQGVEQVKSTPSSLLSSIKSDLKSHLDKHGFETLLKVNGKDGGKVLISGLLSDDNDDCFDALLLSVADPAEDSNVLLEVLGDCLSIDEIADLSVGNDLPGFKHLEKVKRKK